MGARHQQIRPCRIHPSDDEASVPIDRSDALLLAALGSHPRRNAVYDLSHIFGGEEGRPRQDEFRTNAVAQANGVGETWNGAAAGDDIDVVPVPLDIALYRLQGGR
jgi:hypothetical protein